MDQVSLANLLRYLSSGFAGQAADSSVLGAFGGDALLNAARSYDPNARWEEVATPEGGSGKSLVVDIEKLPGSKAGKAGYDLRTSDFGKLKNPRAVVDDPVYGKVTNSANVARDADPLWTKLAPLAVTMLAPMAGAALAGAGIGGAAGLTSAATGSGLVAGAKSTLPSWLTSALAKTPSYAAQLSSGKLDPLSLALGQLPGVGQSAFGINPNITKIGLTLGQIARGRR